MTTHLPDCADECNGDWCACSCHQGGMLELAEFDKRPDPRRWTR